MIVCLINVPIFDHSINRNYKNALVQEPYSKVSVTNEKDEYLWDIPSDRGRRL